MSLAALNYAAAATFDDGTCVTSVSGCADPLATNYNAAVTLRDDSVCTYSVTGCTDSSSPSYFIEATIDDASCVFGGCTLTRASMGKEPPLLALRLATLAGGFVRPWCTE